MEQRGFEKDGRKGLAGNSGQKLLADDFGICAWGYDSYEALPIQEQVDFEVFGLHAKLFELFAAACLLFAERFDRHAARSHLLRNDH